MIAYILVNNKYRSSVKDVKIIPSEEIVSENYLLLMNMVFKNRSGGRRTVKFRKKLKLCGERRVEVHDYTKRKSTHSET